jgi:condensin complex subunit 3
VQTLANAPVSSPLAEVDVTNVVELLVDLTRPSRLNPKAKNSQDYQVYMVACG